MITVTIMKKNIENWGGNIPGGNFPAGNSPGGSLIGENFLGGSFPDTEENICEEFSVYMH